MHLLHPPDAAALHSDRRRAEDQADPALGQGIARNRHPARHPAVPCRPFHSGRGAAQDRAVLQRHAGGGDRGARCRFDLQDSRPCCTTRCSTRSSATSSASWPRRPTCRSGRSLIDALSIRSTGQHRLCRQVRRSDRVLQVADRSAGHAGIHTRSKVNIHYIDSEDIERRWLRRLAGMDAILVPGGFGGAAPKARSRDPLRARTQGSLPRHLPRHAAGRRRVRPPCRRHDGCATAPSSMPDTPYPVVA
jgi:hypothetical protein